MVAVHYLFKKNEMARKNAVRSENSGSIHFDTRTKAVMAEVSGPQENVKEKVASVREIVTGRSTNEIILVLQFYDYDVEKAIQAFLEDGAKEALTQWHFSGKQTTNKKKKNRKKKQAAEVVSTSSQNGDINGNISKSLPNGSIDHEGSDISKLTESDSETSAVAKAESPVCTSAGISFVNNETHDQAASNGPMTDSLLENLSNMQLSHNETSSPQPQRQPHLNHGHHSHRHRTDSGSHSHGRHRTISEKSNTSTAEHKHAENKHEISHYKVHAGLERSVKDLHRQTVSLERLRLVLNDEVDKAYKRIKTVFEEMRQCLNNREANLMQEMDQVKLMASDTFARRQKEARELKVKVDRSESMNEQELAELRADIKHFVSDRKIDEDLGRTTRFTYDSDHLSAEIGKFGEAVPVKCIYSQRRPSVSSIASSDSLTLSVPSPTTENSPKTESHSAPSLDASEAHEAAELQKRLKGSLQVQGYVVKSATYSSNRPATAPPQGATSGYNSSNREGDNRRNRRFGPRGGGRGGGNRSMDQNSYQGQSSGSNRNPRGRGGYGGRGRGNYQNQGNPRPRSPRKDGPRENSGAARGDGPKSSPPVSVNSNS